MDKLLLIGPLSVVSLFFFGFVAVDTAQNRNQELLPSTFSPIVIPENTRWEEVENLLDTSTLSDVSKKETTGNILRIPQQQKAPAEQHTVRIEQENRENTSPEAQAEEQKPASTPTTVPPPPQNTTMAVSFNEQLASTEISVRDALINILCIPNGNNTRLKAISGSGYVIDTKGIIVTNAHIAQYFLFTEGNAPLVSCTVRKGSPATPAYKATLLYLPSSWISANPDTLISAHPTGTGEHDYAFLGITQSATGKESLPSGFPSLEIEYSLPIDGTQVLLGGYPASFLSGSAIQGSLGSTLALGSIRERFTYGNNTADLLSLGGSAAAQQGSSGGVVATLGGRAIGVIVTSTGEIQTGERDLRAITFGHIDRSMVQNGANGISHLLSQNIEIQKERFSETSSILKNMLLERF